jgi:hypothetical protein
LPFCDEDVFVLAPAHGCTDGQRVVWNKDMGKDALLTPLIVACLKKSGRVHIDSGRVSGYPEYVTGGLVDGVRVYGKLREKRYIHTGCRWYASNVFASLLEAQLC